MPVLIKLLLISMLSCQVLFADSNIPFLLPDKQELNKLRSAEIITNRGRVRFELFPEDAPWHVANFKYRADKGLYRNVTFHIFYPEYIIQAGAQGKSPGARAPYTLPAEFNSHEHISGALGMARMPDYANPERVSSGNQFHIILGDTPRMDGTFTVFGQAVSGLEVLDSLDKGDVVKDVKVYVTKD